MLPFGVTIPATVPQGSEIPEGLMNNPVYYNLLDITIIFSTPYPIYFLHTNTSHKLYFSPQVLQTKLQIHPLPALIHVKNALTSPWHQPLRPHTHFGIRTRNPPHLSNTYSIGRTRKETSNSSPIPLRSNIPLRVHYIDYRCVTIFLQDKSNYWFSTLYQCSICQNILTESSIL